MPTSICCARTTCCSVICTWRRCPSSPGACARSDSLPWRSKRSKTELGRLPLLAPMSDIAGRLSMQIATCLLHQPQGGKGILLGGVPAARRGRVVILGGGVAGRQCRGGRRRSRRRRQSCSTRIGTSWSRRAPSAPNVTGLYPHVADVAEAVRSADMVDRRRAGHRARARRTWSRADMVRTMQPGSVIVDISVDQGGCIETTRPTS